MALTPEQHAQIAAVYDKCAADHMVPPPQRAAFARKARCFACLLAWEPSQNRPRRLARPKKLPTLPTRVRLRSEIPECSQQRGIYLRGSNVGSLAMLLAILRAS